jgi:hypothetical protein
MKKAVVRMKIADVIIKMESVFPLQPVTEESKKQQVEERFNNFFLKGDGGGDIQIEVKIVKNLPVVCGAKVVFVTYHFQDGSENWRLLQKGNTYYYKSPLKDKRQVMVVNKDFDRVTAYLLPKNMSGVFDEASCKFLKEHKGMTWQPSDLIYDFLQVLLINYFTKNRMGIFTHAIGVKDIGGRGLLFAGKSGAGKSTTARIWHKNTKAMVLNDDRIIVRKKDGQFRMYGSPWHGEFSDYLASRIDDAALKRLFFIHHSKENTARQISAHEAFLSLYPALFPPFWDKGCLKNAADFSHELVNKVSCYSLGFVNNEKVIDFVRKI